MSGQHARLPLAALAATPQTAVLDVQNMTCGLCPVTVKKSLEKVAGVSQARIDFVKKTATVTVGFDPTALRPATPDEVAAIEDHYAAHGEIHTPQIG